jgi:hypothetical protein
MGDSIIVSGELTNEKWVESRLNLASLSDVIMPVKPNDAPFVPPPLVLPRLGDLQLHYDTREQGDLSIIEDVISGENMTRISMLDFPYNASPPSVDLVSSTGARNLSVPTARIRLNDDGIQTMMFLMNPVSASNNQYALDYGTNGNSILLGFTAADAWEFFVGIGDYVGDDPRPGTAIAAVAGDWQTVCYVVSVDGANKLNGYFNGSLSVGPLNKTFNLVQPAAVLDIGHVGLAAGFTGGFGAWLQWTTALTAAEVAQAHNFLRAIDAGYGLPEA